MYVSLICIQSMQYKKIVHNVTSMLSIGNEFMKKMRVQGTAWKEQMPLPNLHLNESKYPEW